MGKAYKKINQSGLTLIEVLAALVILGIVFIGIMTVFPQMTVFNERTDSKLDSMNLARLEMQYLQESQIILTDDTTIETIYSDSIYENLVITVFPDNPAEATHKKVEFTANDYDFEILINLSRENVSTLEETENLDTVSLHLVTMAVFKDGQKRSETYGYIAQREVVPIVFK